MLVTCCAASTTIFAVRRTYRLPIDSIPLGALAVGGMRKRY